MNPAPDVPGRTRRLRSLKRRKPEPRDPSVRVASGEVVEIGEAPAVTAGPAKSRAGRAADTTDRGSTQEVLSRQWRLVGSIALLAAGVAFVLLGWWGAAHTNIFTEQIPYLISGGLLGLGLIIVAGIMASSASLERENRELRRDIRQLIRLIGAPQAIASVQQMHTGADALVYDMPSPDGHLFVVPGGLSYHVGGCPILEGKQGVKELTQTQLSGYAPCKLCASDEA